jgi:hypothetical protein
MAKASTGRKARNSSPAADWSLICDVGSDGRRNTAASRGKSKKGYTDNTKHAENLAYDANRRRGFASLENLREESRLESLGVHKARA